MAKDPDFLGYHAGTDGYLVRPHQASQLRFCNRGTLTWKGGISVPVYWATLFSVEDFTATGATVDWAAGMANLERRRESYRAKSSPLLYRGFSRFLEWGRNVGGGHVELDINDLEGWRHEPLLLAVKQLIAFLDNVATDPGPLPPRQHAFVAWRKRKGAIHLEAMAADLAWPDEVPLFAARSHELTDVTIGQPPFRNGPWPERRFAEDEFAPLDPKLRTEIQDRAELVREALKSCPNAIEIGQIGNVDGIERMRAHYRKTCSDFQTKARHLAASSKAFGETHHVFDDTKLWKTMLVDSEQWLARMEDSLARQETEVRTAMKTLMSSPDTSSREIDFDNFPTGDDPF